MYFYNNYTTYLSAWDPRVHENLDNLGSVPWRAWWWLEGVETCSPGIVVNCCVSTDILYLWVNAKFLHKNTSELPFFVDRKRGFVNAKRLIQSRTTVCVLHRIISHYSLHNRVRGADSLNCHCTRTNIRQWREREDHARTSCTQVEGASL